jgi:hypothetical protein
MYIGILLGAHPILHISRIKVKVLKPLAINAYGRLDVYLH